MIVSIALIAAVVFFLLDAGHSQKTIQKGITNGNLKSVYKNYISAIAHTHHTSDLICDNNKKLVYKVLPANNHGKITGTFLHTLHITKYGHYIMVSFINEKGNVYKSRKLYFEAEQSEATYREAMVLQGLPIATGAFNSSLYNNQVPSPEFPSYAGQHKFA